MSQLLPSQEREREETRKRRRLERKKDEDFVLVQLILFSFFKVYLFHLNITSAHGFILHVDYWWFVFNKDGDFVFVQLIHFFFFFFFFYFLLFFYFFLFFRKVYLFHLDVASPDGFILHVDYYFLSCWFFFLFFEKFLLVCFNLLYVVMFLFFWVKSYLVMLKLLCCC